jgi:hypothetical protein
MRLHPQPHIGAGAEGSFKTGSHVGGYSATAGNDILLGQGIEAKMA